MSRFLRQVLLLVASLIFSAVAMFYLFDAGFRDDFLVRVSIGYLGLAGLSYFASLCLRVVRISLIMAVPSRFSSVSTVVGWHSLINYMAPFRIGDFSLPLLLSREVALDIKRGASIFMIVRVMDMLFCAISGILIITFLGIDWWGGLEYPSLSIIVVGVLIAGAGSGYLFRGVAQSIFGYLRNYLLGVGVTKLLVAFGVTTTVWMLTYLMYFLLTVSIGADLGFMDCMFAMILLVPFSLLPVNGVAGVGSFELVWVMALGIFGIEKALALSIAIEVHILTTLLVLIVSLSMALFSRLFGR